jgi:hypothetical protein
MLRIFWVGVVRMLRMLRVGVVPMLRMLRMGVVLVCTGPIDAGCAAPALGNR